MPVIRFWTALKKIDSCAELHCCDTLLAQRSIFRTLYFWGPSQPITAEAGFGKSG